MGTSVNLFGGLRLDAPDAAAMQALIHSNISEAMTHLVGTLATANHCGVIAGMTSGNYVGSFDYPLNAVPILSGWLLDSARQVTWHDGVTNTVDMTAIANINNSKVWGRRSATMLDETVEDRIIISGSVETQTPVETRQRHVVEFTATTGATPAGDGWAEVFTISTWTGGSPTKPAIYARSFAWKGKGTLFSLVDQIVTEIAEIKGIAATSWETAPAINLTDALSQLTTLNATVLGIGLTYLHTDHASENASASGGIGDGLHLKAGGILVSNGSTLSIQSGRGRGLASISRSSTGLYTLTLDFGGNPAGATFVRLSFVPYVGSGNVHAGIWTEPDPVWIWHTYTAGSTTVVFRVSQSGALTDLLTNEGIAVEVF